MCLEVFLASDHPLPLIEFEEQRNFHVDALGESDDAVRQHFARAFVVCLGSSTCCGCGFQHEDDEGIRDRAALADYVARAHREGDVELLVSWNGIESEAPVHRLRMSADELSRRTDWLEELTFVEIR